MSIRHKHADSIHAFAEGAKIEFKGELSSCWLPTGNPMWRDNYKYRIKLREPRRFWVNVYHNGSVYGSYIDRTQGCRNCRDGGETIEVVELIDD